MIRRAFLGAASFAGLAALGACSEVGAPAPVAEQPPVQTVAAPAPAPAPAPRRVQVPSADSVELASFYRRLEADLSVRGLLRRDGGGSDTPFTAAMLARNFEQIALYDEYVSENDELRARTTESRLRRWEMPVRFGVEFGDGVPVEQREADLENVRSYVARLARVTGHPMRYDESDANFHVLILTEDDRRNSANRLRELIPGITDGSIRAFQTRDRGTLCLVLAFSQGQSATYTRAVALIRAEHPELLRLSCIHEELAQGLGLANDSPTARPSIFNDDEEFALLTRHDELLLQMLYDDRLTPGMTAAEARPTVRAIAAELVGGGS
ncbi:hypothetical protein OG2516_06022 [Oceanicola granulosus HTCC2516]|uniref:Lipoprotein n=1 Tax=Oceanicola granulosus (strain ATCC BAA-861 / DSM 15982 / KCTC 12143 / HTCC2516) TaxID=314256 RepID=Q2CAY7_OCEGH|nr:DUF2927 domain-containing protein [Oceanicola granulosus]EAR49838.1 hypothetical protein OG2516_06022 [Oceanicola granulosus HTCC2516]